MRRDVYTSPRCPQDAAHGPVLAWPSRFAGWYCPSQAHVGNPFYHTDLAPASRSADDHIRRELDERQPTKAPVSHPRPAADLPPAAGFGL